jgi:hypothetical protein
MMFPFVYFGVIPRSQDFWNAESAKLYRTSIHRMFFFSSKCLRKTLFLKGKRISKNSRNIANYTIHEYLRSEFSAREDVVSDREKFDIIEFNDSFIYPFIVPTYKYTLRSIF